MAPPPSVEAYMGEVPEPMRGALERLRSVVQAAAPGATDCIYYAMPAIRVHGRTVVSYAAFRDHLSLFPLGSSVLDALGDEVAPYRTGKGTLQFRLDEPLPEELVTRIVQARLAAVAAGGR